MGAKEQHPSCKNERLELRYIIYKINYMERRVQFLNVNIIYLIKLFANMLAIAGQTAGLNELTFFEGTHGCPGCNIID